MEAQRILVATAARSAGELARQHLAEHGFRVSLVASEAEVGALLASRAAFDLVLLDLETLSLDELGLRDGAALPGLVLGLGRAESQARARGFEPAEWLNLSLDSPGLSRTLERVLERQALRAENAELHACARAFDRSRVLGTCLEAADILPLAVEILLGLLERKRAIGRVAVAGPEASHELCVRGFGPGSIQQLGPEIEDSGLLALDPLQGGFARPPEGIRSDLAQRGIVESHTLELGFSEPTGTHGGICVLGDGRPFSVAEKRAAAVVAAQVELALGTAARFAEVRERAFLDDVTSLYNVRYLFSALRREVARAERAKLELSVLFLDLDRFKAVNDTFGHLVGSSVLREFGELLRQGVRSIDTVGRYGGDEFATILVDTPLEAARGVAERIRRAVETRRFGAERGQTCSVTVSIGIASYPVHALEGEALLERADQAMYRAKAQGRNRVCTAADLENSD